MKGSLFGSLEPEAAILEHVTASIESEKIR